MGVVADASAVEEEVRPIIGGRGAGAPCATGVCADDEEDDASPDDDTAVVIVVVVEVEETCGGAGAAALSRMYCRTSGSGEVRTRPTHCAPRRWITSTSVSCARDVSADRTCERADAHADADAAEEG